MDRTLLDALRCPAPHAEEWLVAMVHAADGPRLREAELACPACGTSYVVRDGVAWFAPPPAGADTRPAAAVAASAADATTEVMAEDDAAERLAALLGVTEGPWPVLLAGGRAATGRALSARVPPPQWWLNPPAPVPPPDTLAAVLHAGARWPLAGQVVAAVALDAAHATPAHLAEAVRVLRRGGRLVAPAAAPLPAGVRELARDAAEWVAEATGPASGLVALRRRAP